MDAKAALEIVSGPHRGLWPDALTDAERRLLAAIRAEGLELVSAWCYGPNGPWQHRRVIRKVSA